jgi:hypothetical protein
MMHMHYATTENRLKQRIPICGYMPKDDELCRDTELVTCPECRDWVIDPDSPAQNESAKSVEQ